MSDVLTQARILTLLSTTKQRGVYEGYIQGHVDSNELAVNISELPYAVGKDYATVRNSLTQNIEKKSKENEWPELKVLVDKCDSKDKSVWQVILVNMSALVGTESAENDDSENFDGNEDLVSLTDDEV